MRWVTAEPKGFRDIYWCPYLNEPVILKWHRAGVIDLGNPAERQRPHCDGCGASFDTIEDLAEEHTFICHILKPREN